MTWGCMVHGLLVCRMVARPLSGPRAEQSACCKHSARRAQTWRHVDLATGRTHTRAGLHAALTRALSAATRLQASSTMMQPPSRGSEENDLCDVLRCGIHFLSIR
jgi:hypothetical protein